MSTIPLTKRGAEKLRQELHRLKTVERHAVIRAIADARAQGDLSENAEYEAAKDKQGFIEGRIAEIESKLAAAQVIDPSSLDADGRVVFGATVDLADEISGAPVTYQIVGDDEADLKRACLDQLADRPRADRQGERRRRRGAGAGRGSSTTRSSTVRYPLRVDAASAVSRLRPAVCRRCGPELLLAIALRGGAVRPSPVFPQRTMRGHVVARLFAHRGRGRASR